ncbi:MAG: DUF2089 domain-containing protein [Bdellovibrio sp.]|nr:DUF2089 domain-containing protein [Bdellovibrio sp.]
MNKMLAHCPICHRSLYVRELECQSCHTSIRGEFELDTAKVMDDEISHFIKVFIHAEGNIKRVEKILNCSYPKVKNLLKKAQAHLGLKEQEIEDSDRSKAKKDEILDLLESGEISADEAIKRLHEK